jgi:G3E family GTPase
VASRDILEADCVRRHYPVEFCGINYPAAQDKATEEQVSEALYLIESMNPTCRVIKSTRCEIDMESIFKPQPYKPQLLNIQDTKHLHAKTTINHVLVTVDVAYSKEKWEQIFGEILWEMDHKVLRSKGVLKIIDDIQVHSVQGYLICCIPE